MQNGLKIPLENPQSNHKELEDLCLKMLNDGFDDLKVSLFVAKKITGKSFKQP